MQESNNAKAIEMSKASKGPSKTAETIAMVRVSESRKPEDERICYDPYAIRFISKEVLELTTRNPEKYRAFVAQNERLVPGAGNSIVARVRYFDDVVNSSVGDGLEQLVILGAGYDTRAYRIEGLKNVGIMYTNDEGHGGRPNYDVVFMIKLLVLQHWYGLSDLQFEREAYDRLSFRHFLGYPTKIPDHSTIWLFRERLIATGKENVIWEELQRQIDQKGLTIRRGVIQDASFIHHV